MAAAAPCRLSVSFDSKGERSLRCPDVVVAIGFAAKAQAVETCGQVGSVECCAMVGRCLRQDLGPGRNLYESWEDDSLVGGERVGEILVCAETGQLGAEEKKNDWVGGGVDSR